ncbi:putative oxidoreductase YuxG [Thermogemmatispora aurantia]|uniref:Putative oxidoreductase YuxG n=1 Tax=Thermogemmatispora aurantia TaxID=2045279 RepID=A0A5J4KHR3_9CHLR|nr:bifunctional aldolase/short-chain dehydrogenase [Thermogemmatispora aurantia]GER85739.1 putative oxidoreductase YuxG [Thermogemmatispora aurantia]
MPRNLWRDDDVRGQETDEVALLLYRSHLLGRDRSLANWGGGNTSVKLTQPDFRGRPTRIMWVKGSGSDLATMTMADFVPLRLDDVLPLEEREALSDEEMVAYLLHCLAEPGRPRPSIETLLHAFLPFAHVDHTHPDAILAFANAQNGRRLAEEVFGRRLAWIPYIRPGFTLARQVAQAVRANPEVELVILEKHGLVTWGDSARSCYEQTLRVVQEAEDFVAAERQRRGRTTVLVAQPGLSAAEREQLLTAILPGLRGQLSQPQHMVLAVDNSEEALTFASAPEAREVARRGSACPDHLVHTRHWPVWVPWEPAQGAEALQAALRQEITAFRHNYQRYFEECHHPGDVLLHANPRIVVVPHLGIIASGRDAQMAGVARDLYQRAAAVMRACESIDRFTPLSEQEAYDIEYWPLELYKLTRRPPEKELAGRIALVTGGGSGIGRATALRLAAEGAHVAILDLNPQSAQEAADAIAQQYGQGRALACPCDVSDEEQVAAAFAATVRAYGGLDIVVSNAGFAAAAPLTETRLQDWRKVFDVLVQGYFLVARAAFRLWQQQGIGGSLIFITSKNAVVAGKENSAYSAAKAAEQHLARCLAEEGGPLGVRVNVVMPDAVLRGSGIWSSAWREERARAYGIAPEQLEDYYRQRTTLKVNVFPEDVAEAVLFYASDRSSKTTGSALTVDGGVPAAYLR